MTVSTSTIAYALKRVYTTRAVENAVYKDNPALAVIPKKGGFEGSHAVHSIRYRDTLGRSPSFSTAKSVSESAAGSNLGVQMLLTRQKEYQLYSLETEAMLAGRSNLGSLMRTLSTEVDAALNNMNRAFGQAIHREGYGELAQVTSIAAGPPITITVGEAITNFEKGMTLVPSTGATKTAALRGVAGAVVVSVDRDAGTLVIDANPDGILANDWLFVKGDRASGAITAADALKISGFEAWNPATAPTSGDSFFGVDRSVDATRLAGMRLDISALTPEEGLVTALSRAAREGASPSVMIAAFSDVLNIHKALGAKAETEFMQVGDIGFSTIRVTGPKGSVRIVGDQNAPAGVGRLLTPETWELHHLGDFVNVIDNDGLTLRAKTDSDSFEGRMGFYGNLRCFAPGKNMRLVLPT